MCIIGLVVEYVVAIDVTRVRFPDDANYLPSCTFRFVLSEVRVTAVGFEPTPFRTGACSQRLRPLGHTVSVWCHAKHRYRVAPKTITYLREVLICPVTHTYYRTMLNIHLVHKFRYHIIPYQFALKTITYLREVLTCPVTHTYYRTMLHIIL